MKRTALALVASLAVMLVAAASFAGPPLNGVYKSTDLGGVVNLGRYSEAWDAGGGAILPGTTLNAQSWDGTTLGTMWKYWCSTLVAAPVLLVNTVDANGNGQKTYMKTFVGGYLWLSGTGPWANGDVDYPGLIDTYYEFETIQYVNWVRVAAITNVQATQSAPIHTPVLRVWFIAIVLSAGNPAPHVGLSSRSRDSSRFHRGGEAPAGGVDARSAGGENRRG